MSEIKASLHQLIDNIHDNDILEAVHLILAKNTQQKIKTDFWETISSNEKQAILKGLAELDDGHQIPHHKAKEIYQKWL